MSPSGWEWGVATGVSAGVGGAASSFCGKSISIFTRNFFCVSRTISFITLISLSANKKLDRYREVNPGHWKALIESDRSLKPPKSSMKIWRVGQQTGKKEGASCPVYMIAGDRLRTVQVLLFCEGKWRKAFNTGPHSGSWEKDLSNDYRKMKEYLSD